MSKYRLSNEYNDVLEYQCLKCKQYVSQNITNYCSYCGIKWTELFTKKNKRWHIPYRESEYSIGENKYYSKNRRLIIEHRRIISKSLNSDSFSVIFHKPKYTNWSLIIHSEIGICGEKSTSALLFDRWNKYIKDPYYEELRMLLINKCTVTIIKEWSSRGIKSKKTYRNI